MDYKLIYENEFFIFYLKGESLTNIHLDSKSKDEQEKYDSEEIMSNEEKLKRLDLVLEYFYNLWKYIETSKDEKIYIMNFNINLIMINVPISYFAKFKKILDSLKSVINTNLEKTYFKVENKLAKYFLDVLLTFYTPIKPIIII